MLDNLKYHVDIYLEIKRMRYWKEVTKTFRIGWSGPNCSLALFQLELHCCIQADKRRVGGVWASRFKGTVASSTTWNACISNPHSQSRMLAEILLVCI